MELLQELLLTALIAVFFSFLIAKLVSMAMASADSSRNPHLSHTQNVVRDTADEEDIQYHQRLQVDRFQSEKKVQFVAEEAQMVDQFLKGSVDSSVQIDRGIVEEEDECCEELPQKSIEEIPKVIDEFQRSAVDEKEIEVVDNLLEEENLKIGMEKDVVEEESEAIVSEADEKQIKIDSDDDDDWEGIERSELENIFAEATKFMEDEDLRSDVQMELYGLHKVATEGPCREQAPMPLKVAARAKWNAWQRLGNMSPEVAMEQYVALVSDNVPTWKEDKFVGVGKPDPLEVETTEESKDAEDIPSTAKDDLTGGPILESLGKD